MRKSSSIRFVTPIQRDLSLFKSVLTTFGHQPNTDWHYQEDGYVDVVLIDLNENEHYVAKLEQARSLGRVVVLYTKDTIEAPINTFVLRKPARARDVLSLLATAEARIAALDKQAQTMTKSATTSESHHQSMVDNHKVTFAY
jgi:hypothetical protein